MLILGIVSKVKVFKNIHTYDSISSSCYSSHAKSCCRCFKSLNGVHLCWIQLIWKGTHLFKLTEFKLTEYIWSLYEVSQLTVEVRVQTPGKKSKEMSSDTNLAPNELIGLHHLKWKKFETTRALPRAPWPSTLGGMGPRQDHCQSWHSSMERESSKKDNYLCNNPPIRPAWQTGQIKATP